MDNNKHCKYLGDVVRRDIRTWHLCNHPLKPNGQVVCSCKGCNSTCYGYKIKEPWNPKKKACMYHIYPVKNSIWKWRIIELAIVQFNFDIIFFGIALDHRTEKLYDVVEFIETYIKVPYIIRSVINNGNESCTWDIGVKELSNYLSDDDFVLRAHAKGTTKLDLMTHYHTWASLALFTNIYMNYFTDDMMLNGPFFKYHPLHKLPWGNHFHYAGSWYWTRFHMLLDHPLKDRDYYAVERWPSTTKQNNSMEGVYSIGPPYSEIASKPGFINYYIELLRCMVEYSKLSPVNIPGNEELIFITPTNNLQLCTIRRLQEANFVTNVRRLIVEDKYGHWGTEGRNQALDEIQAKFSSNLDKVWIFFLDDDTIINPLFLMQFRAARMLYPNSNGFVFSQLRINPPTVLQPVETLPSFEGKIDTGSFVLRGDLAVKYRWVVKFTQDGIYFEQCFRTKGADIKFLLFSWCSVYNYYKYRGIPRKELL